MQINNISAQILIVLIVLSSVLSLCALGLVFSLFWFIRQRRLLKGQFAALKKSEERFRSLYEEAPLAYQSLDQEGRLVDVNPAWLAAMGYTREEVLGRWMGDFMVPSSRARFQSALEKFQRENVVHGIEFQFVRKNGQVMTVSVEGRIVHGPTGDFKQTHCIIQDVSARQTAQDALRQSEERFAKAFRISPDSININRLSDGLYIDVNEGFCRMTGFTREDVLGKTSTAINIWANAESRRQMIRQLLTEGEVIDFETQFRMKDGKVRTGTMSTRALEIGGEACILSITRDITERKQSEMEIRRQIKRLAALHAIDNAIISGGSLEETLIILLTHVTEQLEVESGAVLLYQPATQSLTFGSSYGIEPPCRLQPITPSAFSLAWQAIQTNKAVCIQPLSGADLESLCATALCGESYNLYYAYPLVTKSGPVGVLEIFSKQDQPPDADWLQFLAALANQAAIAIENMRLFRDLQRANVEMMLAYDETIQGMVAALELRDGDTEGHSQRVADLTVRLAQRMGLEGEDLVHLRRGALLHDLGKMGVPDHILRKPGALNEDEMEIMRQHPTLAYQFLSRVDFLYKALDIPHYHHEHWDGKGYPDQRKGEQIPLPARIFAVVDVWDALLADRPYRQRWSVEQVKVYLHVLSGQQFDPAVVNTFLAMIEEEESNGALPA